ncbi:hypothetical protein [Paenibacillus algicola]|nr:hypothetical protein [Paenibacillus algicola]
MNESTKNKVYFFTLANDVTDMGESEATILYNPYFFKRVIVPTKIDFHFVMGLRLDVTTVESLTIEVETPSGEIIFEGDATSLIDRIVEEKRVKESQKMLYFNLKASKQSGLAINEYGIHKIFIYLNDVELYQTELLIRKGQNLEEEKIDGDSNGE